LLREQRRGDSLEVVRDFEACVVVRSRGVVAAGSPGALPPLGCVSPGYVLFGLMSASGPDGDRAMIGSSTPEHRENHAPMTPTRLELAAYASNTNVQGYRFTTDTLGGSGGAQVTTVFRDPGSAGGTPASAQRSSQDRCSSSSEARASCCVGAPSSRPESPQPGEGRRRLTPAPPWLAGRLTFAGYAGLELETRSSAPLSRPARRCVGRVRG
jgi:hypothetical protein